ncbi:hypothetical protein RUM43_007607 [Polyplax serrata]|uniref:Uncharacterized protein n=1 Tax=Polyplax serrata TaxID=468196 RepID=A0AAN8P8R9_POLSC
MIWGGLFENVSPAHHTAEKPRVRVASQAPIHKKDIKKAFGLECLNGSSRKQQTESYCCERMLPKPSHKSTYFSRLLKTSCYRMPRIWFTPADKIFFARSREIQPASENVSNKDIFIQFNATLCVNRCYREVWRSVRLPPVGRKSGFDDVFGR